MPNLPRLGTNAVTAEQHHQCAKRGIISFGRAAPRRLGWNLNATRNGMSCAQRPAKHSGKAVRGSLVKVVRAIRQRRSPRHRYNPAIPSRLKLISCDQFGLLGWRPHHKSSLVIRLTNNEESAVTQGRYPWQLGGGKPFPVGPAFARFEAKPFGTTQDLRGAHRGGTALLANLIDVGFDAVNAQQ